jgi:hypothetical protein
VTGYDRGLLVETVILHHKDRIEGCRCGWAELGRCHGQHVADVYERAVALRVGSEVRP